jgi:hypothetical protein
MICIPEALFWALVLECVGLFALVIGSFLLGERGKNT